MPEHVHNDAFDPAEASPGYPTAAELAAAEVRYEPTSATPRTRVRDGITASRASALIETVPHPRARRHHPRQRPLADLPKRRAASL